MAPVLPGELRNPRFLHHLELIASRDDALERGLRQVGIFLCQGTQVRVEVELLDFLVYDLLLAGQRSGRISLCEGRRGNSRLLVFRIQVIHAHVFVLLLLQEVPVLEELPDLLLLADDLQEELNVGLRADRTKPASSEPEQVGKEGSHQL